MSKRNRHITTFAKKSPQPVQQSTGIKVSNDVPKIDPKKPVPLDWSKMFGWNENEGYLSFLDERDNFDRQLLELRVISTTHNACIKTKSNYCAGNGFYDASGGELPKEIEDWLKNVNLKNQSAREITKKCFLGKFGMGNRPVEIVLSDVGGKKDVFVYAHNLKEWRLGLPDETGIVKTAVQSRLFGNSHIIWTQETLKKSRVLPLYNPRRSEEENWLVDGTTRRTMIWYQEPEDEVDHYGMPSSVASMIYQLNEYKGARFNLDLFENNGIVGGMLILQGMLSQQEADRIGRKANDMITGDGKRGRMLAFASEEGVDKSEYHSFDTKREGSFLEADNLWTQKIILANEWDAILAGIVSPSTLGKGSGFVTKIMEIKQNSVIKPNQEDIMEKVWQPIFKIAEEWLRLPFSQYDIQIKSSIDISGLTDVDITPAVQVNEVRQAKNLPIDPEKEGVYMTQMKTNQQDGKKEEDDVPTK